MSPAGATFLVGLGAAGWLLGHVAFEAGVRRESPTRFLPTFERLFAKLALGFALLTWWGVLLAEIGWFEPGTLIGGPLVAALAVAAPTWRSQRRTLQRLALDLDYSPAVVTLLAAIALFFYFPPFPVYTIGKDPAVYQFAGVHLGREGSLVIHDELLASLEPELRDWFYPPGSGTVAYDGSRFIGFYLEDAQTGRVVPQFLPVMPAWIAVGWLAGGREGALAVPAWLALFAAVAVYYLGRRLVHPAVGTGAAVLLGMNFVQGWFARYTNAEMAAQALIFVGLYGLTLQRRHADPFFGLMAGVALSLTWMTKVELGLLGVALLALLLADLSRQRVDRSVWLSLWLPVGLVSIHALVHVYGWSWPYISDLLVVVSETPSLLVFMALLGVGLVGGAAAAARRLTDAQRDRSQRFLQGASRAGRRFRWGLTPVVVLLAAYAYWIRPDPENIWSSLTMVRLGWAVTGTGLCLAVLGTVLFLHDRGAQRGFGAIFGILLALTSATLWKPLIFPDLMWAYRRFLPVVIPATLLFAAYGWWRLWDEGPSWAVRSAHWLRARSADRRRGGAAGGGGAAGPGGRRLPVPAPVRFGVAVVLAAAAGWVVWQSWVLARTYQAHRELEGSVELLAELDGVFEDDAVLLFEPLYGLGLDRLEAPMAFLHEHPVLRLRSPQVDPEMLRRFVRSQTQRRRPVYLLATGRVDYFPYPHAEPHRQVSRVIVELEEINYALPTGTKRSPLFATTYRLQPGGDNRLDGELDVGTFDDLWTQNFHAAEYESHPSGGGWSFRWTQDESLLRLPGLGPAAGEVMFTIGIGTDYPADAELPEVRFELDGMPMGSVRVERGWWDYRMSLPPGWSPDPDGVPTLVLHSDVWSPAEVFGGGDSRRLGVKLDRVLWGEAMARALEEGVR